MMRDVTAVHGWLVAGAQGAATSPEVFQRCCDELRAAGVPLDRAAAYVRTLHPLLSGRSFLWEPGRRVEVGELPREGRWSSDFLQSPVKVVQDSALPVRVRLADGTAGAVAYPICAELARQGFTDYHAAPIRFLDGTVHAVTFATRRPGGFEDGDVAALEHVLVPLARVAEILALRRTAANVL